MVDYDKIPVQELTKIDKICIICWGLIGDVFIRVSLLESVKKHFPEARLTVIVDPAGAVALENHPDVDEIVKISRKPRPFLSSLSEKVATLYQLYREKFDLSIDLYCGGSSSWVTRFINARLRISFNHKSSLRRANNYLVAIPDFCGHWTLELANMLLPLGIKEVRRGTSYYCSKASYEFADQWLAHLPGQKLIVNLGAGAENKIWSIENYVKLVWEIQKNHSFHAIVLTNPGQKYLVDKFESLVAQSTPSGGFEYTVLPETSFANVAAVISRVGLIITGDTSIMHLAFGLKCPTLGIFTRTRPEVVDPEDCIHVACFKQGTEEDRCGKLFGSRELSPETCYARFEDLLLVTRRKNSHV